MLLLPFFGWVVTGFIFFVKPGYDEAYETLKMKTYPLNDRVSIIADSSWMEFRVLRTILGHHLLIRTLDGWKQLDRTTLQPATIPAEAELRRLVNDAVSANPQRYGTISSVSGNTIHTVTGVEITIDWDRMSLYQKGKDTERIDRFYKIHYLQWTGIPAVDKYLGIIGLGLVLILSVLGLRLTLKK